jgi:nickel-dependent lactate racemase
VAYVGTTRRGTPVFLNKRILDADYVIVCGSVTHDPFAGFGGGPRLMVPGCAGQETIIRHQILGIDPEASCLHPRCRDAIIEANPLQEDAREAFRLVTINFLLHTVLNEHNQIIGAVAGEPLQAYAAGCRMLDDIYRAPANHLADLVIVSGGGLPSDDHYRKAHTALHRAARVVRRGGVIIFLAACQKGIGSSDLLNWFRQEAAGLTAENQPLAGMQKIDVHRLHHYFLHNCVADGLIALSTMQKARENRIIAVTELEPQLVKNMGFIPAESFRHALELAEPWLPDIYSAYVIPNGSLLVPYLSER